MSRDVLSVAVYVRKRVLRVRGLRENEGRGEYEEEEWETHRRDRCWAGKCVFYPKYGGFASSRS